MSDTRANFSKFHPKPWKDYVIMTTPSKEPSVDEIFDPVTMDYLEIPQWWIDKTKAQLLAHDLSCLPGKVVGETPRVQGYNQALTDVEQNLREKYE